MRDSCLLPTWPPTVVKAGSPSRLQGATRAVHKHTRTSRDRLRAGDKRCSGGQMGASPAVQATCEGAEIVSDHYNSRSVLTSPIFSGDYCEDDSDISDAGDACSESPSASCPFLAHNPRQRSMVSSAAGAAADDRTRSSTLAPTTDSPKKGFLEHGSKCGGGSDILHHNKEPSSSWMSAKPPQDREVAMPDAGARCSAHDHTNYSVDHSAAAAAMTPNTTTAQKAAGAHLSRKAGLAAMAAVGVQRGDRRPPLNTLASNVMPSSAETDKARARSRLVDCQARPPRLLIGRISSHTVEPSSSLLESQVLNDIFGVSGFVTQRNGMHTAWRRANPAVIHTTSTANLAQSPPPPPLPLPAATEGSQAPPHSVTRESPTLLNGDGASLSEKSEEPKGMCLRRQVVLPSPPTGESNSTSTVDARSPEESRLFLRRHGLSECLSRKNLRVGGSVNTQSLIQGFAGKNRNSTGGARHRSAGEMDKVENLSPVPPTTRFSSASLECLTDVALPPSQRAGESRRASAPAALNSRAVRSRGDMSNSGSTAVPRRRSQRRLGGSPDGRPVGEALDQENVGAVVASLSATAARKNLAAAARRSKVGTKADPVTLYRQRLEAEARRLSAARKRTARRQAGARF